MVAHRGAAEGDHEVSAGLGDRLADGLAAVAHPGDASHLGTPGLEHGRQPRGAGVIDLPGAGPGRRLDHLLARGHDADARPPDHADTVASRRGAEGQPPGVEPKSGSQEPVASPEVAAGMPDIVADDGGGDLDPIAVPSGVFLDDHRVRALWQGRAREDPDRLARRKVALEPMTRSALADDDKPTRGIGGADRPPVHGGIGKGRLVTDRADILCEYPAEGLAERQVHRLQGADLRQHGRTGGLDRHQLHGWAQSPERPPDLDRRRTSSMTMPRSAALSMS